MFKVKITGFNGFEQQFSSTKKDMATIVEQEIESMAKKWVAGAKRDAPADQGTLRGSISYLINDKRAEIVAGVFYAPFMEFGTKGKYRAILGTEAIAEQFKGFKGGDIKQMIAMIVRWVGRKGVTGRYSVKTRKRLGSKLDKYAEDYAAAWPIVMSILKNGINPHPFFFKQQEVVWPEMIKNIKNRLEQGTKVSVIMPGDIFRPQITTI